jgi:oxygen-independent coproporphyrinogen III oxidase
MKKLGIYIHIPFCMSKCNYCDFTSFAGFERETFENYTKALKREIKGYAEGAQVFGGKDFSPSDYMVDTIFMGGGTPSLFPLDLFTEIVESVSDCFTISENLEFTIESNPKTLNRKSLSEYINLSINRLSMGAQSFDDGILKMLGRSHDSNDIEESYFMAREAGFNNINLDFIFGIPNQSMTSWDDTIRKAKALNPEHLSIYNLKIEENTPFNQMLKEGKIAEIDDSLDRKMYSFALDALTSKKNFDEAKNKYNRYEISNLSHKGYECNHNLKYWSMEEFLGIGLNAHSYINNARTSNISNLKDYIANIGTFKIWEHENDIDDEISEYIFTGMRKTDGISFKEFNANFNINIDDKFREEIEKLTIEKLVIRRDGFLSLTDKGINISNYVLSHFV